MLGYCRSAVFTTFCDVIVRKGAHRLGEKHEKQKNGHTRFMPNFGDMWQCSGPHMGWKENPNRTMLKNKCDLDSYCPIRALVWDHWWSCGEVQSLCIHPVCVSTHSPISKLRCVALMPSPQGLKHERETFLPLILDLGCWNSWTSGSTTCPQIDVLPNTRV